MKNLDFKQIKGIKTPESWIENAINIPQRNKKVIPFYLKPYFIASVASLVICCTICLTVFFKISNNATVPISPNTTQCTTETTENTKQTETIEPTAIIPTTTVIQESTSIAKDISNPIVNTKPTQTQRPTINIVIEPTEETVSTTAPTDVIEPSEPTETTIQTEPVEETSIPIATESPTVIPVEPTATQPMITEPVTENPTTQGGSPPTETYATIYFSDVESRGFSMSNDIYCHIETSDGDSSAEMFTNIEKMYWNSYSGYAFYQSKLKMYTQYNITFYDEYGNSYTADIYYYGGFINI